MGLRVPSLSRPTGRYRAACEYCKGDPVRAVCVNCGAPQYSAADVEAYGTDDLIEVTTLCDPVRRFIAHPPRCP